MLAVEGVTTGRVYSHTPATSAVLQRSLLVLAIPHRSILFDRACAPVLLHIIPCSRVALKHMKANKSSHVPCFFRAICLFILGSAQPFP